MGWGEVELKCSVRRASVKSHVSRVTRLMTSAWRPELLSLPSCSTLPISTVNLDIATSPFLISDVLEKKSFSTDAFSKDGKRKVALSENPLPWAPLKWANKTLVRPAERNVSFSNAIAHLRTCRQQERHSYLRTWALDSLPKFAASLPIAPALRLAGPLLQQANLWLGDGGLHSAVHFDDRDNLMLQLSGSKEVLLLPPTLLERLGYEPREERRFKSGPSLAAGPLSTTSPTGRTPVENHSPFQPFAVGLGGSTREEEEGAAHDTLEGEAELLERLATSGSGALLCTLNRGEALYVPALWSHAVASSTSSTSKAATVSANGEVAADDADDELNTMVNLWFLREGLATFEAALAAAPDFAQAHTCHGSALSVLGRHSDAASAFERAVNLRPNGTYYEATHHLGLALVDSSVNFRWEEDETEQLEKAASLLRQAYTMRPSDAMAKSEYINGLGKIGSQHARNARYTEAAFYYRKAIKLSPNRTDLYRHLAMAYQDRNDKEGAKKAVAALEVAQKLEPKSKRIKEQLRVAEVRAAIKKSGGWSREVEQAVKKHKEDTHDRRSGAD